MSIHITLMINKNNVCLHIHSCRREQRNVDQC